MIEIIVRQRTHDLHETRIISPNKPEFNRDGVFIKSFSEKHHFFPYRNILHIKWFARDDEDMPDEDDDE